MTEIQINLDELLVDLRSRAKRVLNAVPAVEVAGPATTGADIPSAAAEKWLKIPDVVVVVCDLKGSTGLGTGKHDTSTARIYKSSVEGAVRILHDFGADFIDIQGDGGFGVFWGEKRYERALCAGITIRTFSDQWFDELRLKDASAPETGFKVGLAAERVLVKYLGTRNPAFDEQEPVWAGKPVNYAAKCAQSAELGQLVVTEAVWAKFESNDYVTHSCDCGADGPAELWSSTEVDTLPDGSAGAALLTVGWCETCGPDFCRAILDGEKVRSTVTQAQRTQVSAAMKAAIEMKRRARATYPKW